MAEFTYFGSLIQNHEAEKFLAALVVGGALVAITRSASTKLSTPEGVTQAIIPSKSLNLSSFFDLFVEFFVRFQDSILGKERRQYLPFTGTIFLFLLTSNLLGLIPGMPALTTTVWVNVGFAFVVFFYFHIQGIKTHGLGGYKSPSLLEYYRRSYRTRAFYKPCSLRPTDSFLHIGNFRLLYAGLYLHHSYDGLHPSCYTTRRGTRASLSWYVLSAKGCSRYIDLFRWRR